MPRPAPSDRMDPAVVVPLVASAAVLGVSHGLEPDHAAGVLSLSTKAGGAGRSALIGAAFGAGHVVLVGVWLVVARTALALPVVGDAMAVVGTAVAGAMLLGLSTVLAYSGLRSVIHAHRHRHGPGQPAHSHVHVHLPGPVADRLGLASHDHEHSVRSYLVVGVIGALFTLSPPVSMLAFLAVVTPNAEPSSLAVVVAAYALAITATMAAVGGGVGALVRPLQARSARTVGAVHLTAGLAVFATAVWVLTGAIP